MNWLPPNGALHGAALDHLLGLNLAIVFWLFVAAQILIVIALFRRGSGSNVAKPGRALLIVDYAVLLAITGLYLWMVASSHRLWAASREQPALLRLSKLKSPAFSSSGTSAIPAKTVSTAQLSPRSSARRLAIHSVSILPIRIPLTTSSRRSSCCLWANRSI